MKIGLRGLLVSTVLAIVLPLAADKHPSAREFQRVRFISFNEKAPLSDADITAEQRKYKVPYAATLVEISVDADAGTPSVVVGKNHGGIVSDLLSRPLTAGKSGQACANSGATVGLDGYKCSATLQDTLLSKGDFIETRRANAGGIAQRLIVSVALVKKREEK